MNTLTNQRTFSRPQLKPRQSTSIQHATYNGHRTFTNLGRLIQRNQIGLIDTNWFKNTTCLIHLDHSSNNKALDLYSYLVLYLVYIQTNGLARCSKHFDNPKQNNTGDVEMSTTHSKSSSVLQARIVELTAKGYPLRIAERVAKRERKASHPLHIRAVQRKVEAATRRLEAVGVFAP